MASQWFVRGGGQVYGPMDSKKLKQLVTAGKIDESTEIAQDTKGPWTLAGKVRGLFNTQAPVAASTPPSPEAVLAAVSAPAPVFEPQEAVAVAVAPAKQSVAQAFLQTKTVRMAAAFGACSLLSLVAGYFVGREHLRYQISSAFKDVGKEFAKNIGQAFTGGRAPSESVEEKKPEPLAKLKLGQTYDTPSAAVTVKWARVEQPLIKGGLNQTTQKAKEPALLIGLSMSNKDSRKVLDTTYSGGPFESVFSLEDDATNRIATAFFSSPSNTQYTIVGAHPSYKNINPEETVDHIVGFDVPLPKTQSLKMLIDLTLIGQKGEIQVDMPIEAVEGFAAQ